MTDILIVAATEGELGGLDGLVCGIGPVEAAAATARALALRRWEAVLHVGIAGGRQLAPGTLAIGAEAVYCDIAAAITLIDRVAADPQLLDVARRVLPDAPILTIGTSAAVGATHGGAIVEAMEGFGVLRAAELAGVPAVEVRAISNAVGETNRSLWQLDTALEALAEALPRLREAIAAVTAP